MLDSTRIEVLSEYRGRAAVILAWITSMILFSCKDDPTPKELAKAYCNCVQARKHIQGQMKYIPCNEQAAEKSAKYKRWLWRTTDTVIIGMEKFKLEDDKFVADMLLEVDKICPGE